MMIKMDTDAVRAVASSMQNLAEDFDTRFSSISAVVSGASWQSQAREEFIENLNMVTQAGTASSSALRLMAKATSRKADQWEAVSSVFNGPFYYLEGLWDNFTSALGNTWNNLLGTIGSIRWPTAAAVIGIPAGIIGSFVGHWPSWKDFKLPDWSPFHSKNNIQSNEIDHGSDISTSDIKSSVSPPEKIESMTNSVEWIGLDQDDPRWGNQIMGMPNHTIDNKGCLITSVAMIARSKGVDATPIEVNTYMKSNGGYEPGSSKMIWGSAEEYLESVTGKSVTYKGISSSNVNSMLQAGNPVIIHVKGNSSDGHWVVATDVDPNGKFIVYESSSGKQSTYSQDQLLSGHRAFEFGE